MMYYNSGNGTYSKNWTQDEINKMYELKSQGLTNQEIADVLERTIASVSIKIKRLEKKTGEYNKKHVKEKHMINKTYYEVIQPESVLELYSGGVQQHHLSTTNDIDTIKEADYHMDALKCLCMLYSQDKEFDVVDLDPYGSAYDLIDIAIKTARKGLIITFGELGHRRFKRLDFAGPRYGINNLEEFTIDKLIEYVQEIGRRNKKNIKVWNKITWTNIGRAWFIIE